MDFKVVQEIKLIVYSDEFGISVEENKNNKNDFQFFVLRNGIDLSVIYRNNIRRGLGWERERFKVQFWFWIW